MFRCVAACVWASLNCLDNTPAKLCFVIGTLLAIGRTTPKLAWQAIHLAPSVGKKRGAALRRLFGRGTCADTRQPPVGAALGAACCLVGVGKPAPTCGPAGVSSAGGPFSSGDFIIVGFGPVERIVQELLLDTGAAM